MISVLLHILHLNHTVYCDKIHAFNATNCHKTLFILKVGNVLLQLIFSKVLATNSSVIIEHYVISNVTFSSAQMKKALMIRQTVQ